MAANFGDAAAIIETARSLPPHTLELDIHSVRGVNHGVFTGCLLWDYVQAMSLLPRQKRPGGFSNSYVLATAGDGIKVTIAYAEIAPAFTRNQVLLAYEQDGEALRSGPRLIVPGDGLGGRSVHGVVHLEVRSLPDTRPQAVENGDLLISGLIDRLQPYSLEELRALPQITVETGVSRKRRNTAAPPRRFSGPTIWSVLERSGMQLDVSLREPFLPLIIAARGHDGYAVAIAGGEIEPRFKNTHVVAALNGEGVEMDERDGPLRLVAPQDGPVARAVKRLASLELLEG
jgi:hypothetical protein